MKHHGATSEMALALLAVLFAFSAPAWDWTGDEKADIKAAQSAQDAWSPAAVTFLLSGFTNTSEAVAIRCMDYVKRMVTEHGVPYDREQLCSLAAGQLPGRTFKLTDKLCYFISDVGPGETGRKKLEKLLMDDEVNNARIAIRCLIGVRASRDIMANVRDAMSSMQMKPAGNRDSLLAIRKAADGKHKNDESFQLYAIRAVGILGAGDDSAMLKDALDPEKTRTVEGKYQVDCVVYALRACPVFPGGRELITPYLTHSDSKIKKEAKKALEEWARKNPGI